MNKSSEKAPEGVVIAAEGLGLCPRCSKKPLKALTGVKPGTVDVQCEDGHAWVVTADEYAERLQVAAGAAAPEPEQPAGKPGAAAPADDDAKFMAQITITMDRRTNKVQVAHKTTGPVEAFGLLEVAKNMMIASPEKAPKIAVPERTLVGTDGKRLN